VSAQKNISVGMVSAAALAAGTNAVAAQDWTGFYAGLSFGSTNGTTPSQPYVYDEGYHADNATALGGFAGVRWSAGDVVIGTELALSGSLDVTEPSSQSPSGDDYTLDNMTDFKISVGVPMGKALVYGFAGVSAVSLGTPWEDYRDGSGLNYGVGVDYMVTSKLSVGAEFISRRMSGYSSGGHVEDPSPLNSVSLRGSFHF